MNPSLDSTLLPVPGLLQRGELRNAAHLCETVLAKRSQHPLAAYYYGLILCQNGQASAGRPWLKIAVNALGKRADVLTDWATCLKMDGDFIGAEKNYRKALRLEPQLAEAWDGLVEVYHKLDRLEEAQEAARKYLTLRPTDCDGWCRLSQLQLFSAAPAHAQESARQALSIDPHSTQAKLALANALINLGASREAGEVIKQLDMTQVPLLNREEFLFNLNALAGLPAAELAEHHFQVGRLLDEAYGRFQPTHKRDADPQRKIRVGLLSGDLCQHPIGLFLRALLQHLPTAEIELVAFANLHKEDSITQELKRHCATWHPIIRLSNQALHQRIINEKIDILIDLSGYTYNNRLAVFAAKPAPIQVSYLGYFATSGLKAIDYILVNQALLPSTERHLYSETPWYLAEAHLCYTPAALPLTQRTRQAGEPFRFGCFSKLIKINEDVTACWARILTRAPESELLIIAAGKDAAALTPLLHARFASHGIAPERVKIEPSKSHQDYLLAHSRVDIMLDPFPYNGTTTTMDALWMGVPVLTVRGDRYVAHMAEAVLGQAGLQDWVAADLDAYVELAVHHASNPEPLAQLRSELRGKLEASPLLDAPRFARQFADALRGMWQNWCNNHPERT